jgi:probable FeS assembly SUF system protein SufT
MFTREDVILKRDCEATVVPAGNKVLIPEGAQVTITQTLGGSFSVITDRGFMARIESADADALGKEPPVEKPASAPTAPTDREGVEQAVWDRLRGVYDPEIPVNIVDLGLVYLCKVEPLEGGGFGVQVQMTMTAPGCGMGDVLREDALSRINTVPGVERAEAEVVWEPVWEQSMMSDAARLQLGMD